jgi:hypothetical protein
VSLLSFFSLLSLFLRIAFHSIAPSNLSCARCGSQAGDSELGWSACEAGAYIGLGRIVALCHRSSTSYQTH